MPKPLHLLLEESQDNPPADNQTPRPEALTLRRRQWQDEDETRAVLAELLEERNAVDSKARAIATSPDANDFSVRVLMAESAALTKLINKFNEHA
jgi:hypothetical protein